VIVIADASPVIFLGKLRRLDLLPSLLGRDIRMPATVRDEVMAPGLEPAERDQLLAFIKTCRVEAVRQPRRFATAMSAADNEALTLALRSQAGLLLCDDRITRRMAEAEGVPTLGTLGVLLRSSRQGRLSTAAARRCVDGLIRSHAFRIGIEVYQAVLVELERQAHRTSK
jgi:predicted nucleic acid-binding protein